MLFYKLVIILCPFLTGVGLEVENADKTIIDSNKITTGKLMSLGLDTYIKYTLEKVDLIIYKHTYCIYALHNIDVYKGVSKSHHR